MFLLRSAVASRITRQFRFCAAVIMRVHRRGFAMMGAGLLSSPCLAFVSTAAGLQAYTPSAVAGSRPSSMSPPRVSQGWRHRTLQSRRARQRASVGVVGAAETDDAKDGATVETLAVGEGKVAERKTEIDKQINQTNFLVGSKMMTISSFGPDSSLASSSKRSRKVSSTSSAVSPEAMLPEAIAKQERLYEKRKWRLIGDNVFLGFLGTSGAWFVSFKAACSYGVGAALGTAYLVLLSRFVENLGKEDSGGGGEEGGGGGGPARLALAGLLVLLVAKNKETLDLIPALAGFLAYQVATLVQGIYTDFDDTEDANAAG